MFSPHSPCSGGGGQQNPHLLSMILLGEAFRFRQSVGKQSVWRLPKAEVQAGIARRGEATSALRGGWCLLLAEDESIVDLLYHYHYTIPGLYVWLNNRRVWGCCTGVH